MKELVLVRHAKSSWSQGDLSDHDRALNERGERDAPRIGQALVEHQWVPDRVLCSTAERAVETLNAVLDVLGRSRDVHMLSELYLADPAAILATVARFGDPAERVVVLGHNPGLEDLVRALTRQKIELKTSAVARLLLPVARFSELHLECRATLGGSWSPREQSHG
jgi:phosphohistidine phosphatase